MSVDATMELLNTFSGTKFKEGGDDIVLSLPLAEVKVAFDGTKGQYPSKNHTIILKLDSNIYSQIEILQQQCLDKIISEQTVIKGFLITKYMLQDHFKNDLCERTSTLKLKTNNVQTNIYDTSSNGSSLIEWTETTLHPSLCQGTLMQASICPSLFWVMEKPEGPMMGLSWWLKEAIIANQE